VEKPTFTVGRLGGPIDPAKDIVPGTNKHLMAVTTGVAITQANKSGVALTSADAPLISVGEPGLWKYSMDYVPTTPAVFVNLYNNMWNTNFALWQEGSWSESVRIWPVNKGMQTVANLTQYGWETRLPLLTGVAEGKAGKLPASKAGISLSRSGILITAFGKNPDGDGTILRLWEQAGNKGSCTVTLPADHPFKTARLCNLRGEPLSKEFNVKHTIEVNIKAYEPVSILLQ